jgi:hypothetical protein
LYGDGHWSFPFSVPFSQRSWSDGVSGSQNSLPSADDGHRSPFVLPDQSQLGVSDMHELNRAASRTGSVHTMPSQQLA